MTEPVDTPARPAAQPSLLAVARCLALDSLAASTADLLAGAGIACVLLKGPATGARIFGDDRNQRLYSDVDLLIAPDRFAAAEKTLADRGYRPRVVGLRESEWVWHERPWAAPNADLTVDLHRGFAGVGDAAAFWAAVWAGREILEVAGEVLAVPGPAAAALILALHAASPGVTRRKPLDDLTKGRAVLGPLVWAAAVELAKGVDAEPACRAGLELLPDGAALADQLGLSGEIAASGRLTARQSSQLSVSLAKLLETSSAAELAVFLSRKLVPSPALLRMRDGGIGAGPRALVRGYLRRWARAAAGSRHALVELRDVRRDAPKRHRRRYRADIGSAAFILTSPGAARTLLWSVRMVGRVRKQLPQRPFSEVVLSTPPALDVRSRSAMNAGLRLRRASCLERALLRQRFDAANGVQRTLIIAVTSPADGFRAHSWLEGDRQQDTSMREIVRHPATSVIADPR